MVTHVFESPGCLTMPYELGMSLFGLTITQDPYFEAWKHEPGCQAIGTKDTYPGPWVNFLFLVVLCVTECMASCIGPSGGHTPKDLSFLLFLDAVTSLAILLFKTTHDLDSCTT